MGEPDWERMHEIITREEMLDEEGDIFIIKTLLIWALFGFVFLTIIGIVYNEAYRATLFMIPACIIPLIISLIEYKSLKYGWR